MPSGLDDGVGVAVPSGGLTPAQVAQIVGRAWESSAEEGLKPINIVIGLDPTSQALSELVQKKDSQLAAMEERLSALEARLGVSDGASAVDAAPEAANAELAPAVGEGPNGLVYGLLLALLLGLPVAVVAVVLGRRALAKARA